MQVVIPIAGKSTRMAASYQGPKQLIHVGGKPLIEYSLDCLPSEVSELVLVVGGPHESQIRSYFGNQHIGRGVTYVVQDEPLGVGHAIQQARDVARGQFLVAVPNDIYDANDLKRMVEQPDLSILVSHTGNKGMFGSIIVDKVTRDVLGVLKTEGIGDADAVFTGAALLDEDFFKIEMPRPEGDQEIEIIDILLRLIEEKGRRVRAIETTTWLSINDPKDLSEVIAQLSG